MGVAALQTLIAREQALIAALDGQDVAAIEAAGAALCDAAVAVQAAGGWRDIPEIKSHLLTALAHADAARIRINYLADAASRRLDGLAALGVRLPSRTAYARKGVRGYRMA